jgi:hypothetical protein
VALQRRLRRLRIGEARQELRGGGGVVKVKMLMFPVRIGSSFHAIRKPLLQQRVSAARTS